VIPRALLPQIKTIRAKGTPEELALLERLLLENDFSLFVREAWPVLEPSTPFVPGAHIDAIAADLERVFSGDVKREIINIPPRFGKSLLTSVLFPCWVWTRAPQTRWIFASYASTLSTKHSVDRRTLIDSTWYRQRWGHVFSLSSDQNVKTEFSNSSRGSMLATSIGGSAMGKGGDFIVVDDPHNPTEAQSDLQRQAAIDFFRQTLSSRLDDQRTGRIVVVMQRLHERDLAGELIAEGGWNLLRLPMEAEAGDPLGRVEGAPLWPERVGPEEIEPLKKALGTYASSGQLQQRPSPAGGGMLKRDWWKEYSAIPADLDELLLSWDLAFKETTGSDFVVGQVWGKKGASCYLLDQVRDRMDFPSTLKAIEALSAKWPAAIAKLVEDKANGPAVISTLKTKIPGLIAVEPRGSKEARASAVSPSIEAGNVFLPAPSLAPWVNDFIEECAAFPRGANDDQVDAMTQALDRMLSTNAWADWAERKAREQRERAA
jgi:predicted phage terminase large subunit-like protein